MMGDVVKDIFDMQGQLNWSAEVFDKNRTATVKIIKYKSVGCYIGEAVEDEEGKFVRQGRGIWIYSLDKRLDGFWYNNHLNGLGRIIEPNLLFKGKSKYIHLIY
jgi:hypothetical protein